MEKTIAVLGGDRRMALLARLLAEDGHPVRTWGLAAFGMEDTAVVEAAQADRLVLPVPLSRGKNLNCTAAALPLCGLFALLRPEQRLYAGGVKAADREAAAEFGLTLTDYLSREELAVRNGVPTAEGAIETAMAATDVTLCGTNTNDASFMKGFSMQGTAGDLINNENVFSIAMCYSTATLDDVKAFFTSERFSDPDSFLAEIDALDLDGNIRNLSGDKMSYFDGNTADPIRFYGDGVDLINGTSLLQQAGEYHFYLVTIGYEKVLWVGEADRTFVMEQSAIDLANDFAAAFDLVTETTLMEDQDVSAMTQEEKTQAVQDYFSSQVDTLDLGITVTAEYDDDPDYPDDYYITLAKDGSESSAYVTVYFGAEA